MTDVQPPAAGRSSGDRAGRTTTRRAVIGATGVGLYATVDASMAGPGCAAAPAASDTGPPLFVLPDRAALAAYRTTAFGMRAMLAEPLRSGMFVARPRSSHLAQIQADPHQAFCVPSSANAAVVWVRDFTGPASLDWGGAQGDGETDDAPFINAMLANPNVSSFRIEDRRTHLLKSPLRIRRSVKLVGAGTESSLFAVAGSCDAIDASLDQRNNWGLQMADFTIVSRLKPGSATAGAGIRLRMAYFAKISNIRVTNCYVGIHSTQSNLTNIDALHINGFVHAGLLFDGGQNYDTRVSGFTISGDKIGRYAIRMDDMCDEMLFSDGVCSTSQYALFTAAASNVVNKRPEFCRFSRVSFDSCTNGIDLAHSVDFVFDGCFVSCRPNNGAQIGVRGPVEHIQFSGTTFFNNARSAAVVGPQAVDTDFLGCRFVSNGTAKPNTHDTLVFAKGCGSFSLANCRFRQGWDVTGVPRYQVRIEPGGAADYAISGNQFAAGGAASGLVFDQRQGAARMVANNSGLVM